MWDCRDVILMQAEVRTIARRCMRYLQAEHLNRQLQDGKCSGRQGGRPGRRALIGIGIAVSGSQDTTADVSYILRTYTAPCPSLR